MPLSWDRGKRQMTGSYPTQRENYTQSTRPLWRHSQGGSPSSHLTVRICRWSFWRILWVSSYSVRTETQLQQPWGEIREENSRDIKTKEHALLLKKKEEEGRQSMVTPGEEKVVKSCRNPCIGLKSCPPEACECDLFWMRVFADAIKSRGGRTGTEWDSHAVQLVSL